MKNDQKIEEAYQPEPCRHCKDPVYDDHHEFEVNGKPACLKCYVGSIGGK